MSSPKRRSCEALLLLAATLIAALPFCSAHVPASSMETKVKAWQPVDNGGPSSFAIPLLGNIYPDGLFYATISIGDPPRPYFLDVDTGSDLTWLHCDAPCCHCPKCPHPLYRLVKNKQVACKDRLCSALPGDRDCDDAPLQCDYDVHYADQTSSLGILVLDAFLVRLANGSFVRPGLAFGCGYDQEGPGGSTSHVDGMLGLSIGPGSLLSQLRAQGVTRGIVGHCISRRGGGYVFFGGDYIPRQGVAWTPMIHAPSDHYIAGPANLFIGEQNLGVGVLQLVFDTGSSYTYLAAEPYQAFLSAVKNDLLRSPLKEAPEDHTLPVCWKGPQPIDSVAQVRKYFRTLALSFGNGRGARLEIPPENYLIISKFRNACLGILTNTVSGMEHFNVVGDISMQDLIFVYDSERHQIGWALATCDRLPNSIL